MRRVSRVLEGEDLKHYGDITKLNGAELPIVDIITGGSPCQDLSVAGKRAGLAGERSGLFMEQIRIIKEMRKHDRESNSGANDDIRLVRPRYMVWENVPGAFSSNKGEDFRAVLEETARIADENAAIPGPPGGVWSNSGCILADRWSIAWRVHDAQFWGVPQRRRRISLVADFGGQTAPEILFERESVSGDITESEETGKESTGEIEDSIGTAIYDVRISSDGTKNWRAHAYRTDISRNLDTGGVRRTVTTEGVQSSNDNKVYGVCSFESNSMKSQNPESGFYEAETSRTLDNAGGNPACNQGGMIVLEGNGTRDSHRGDGYKESDVSYTLNSTEQHGVCCMNPWDVQSKHIQPEEGKAEALYAGECRYGGGESYVMQKGYSQDAYDKYTETDKGASVKASGGNYGGVQRI